MVKTNRVRGITGNMAERAIVGDLGLHEEQVVVFCDSQSAICLAKDQVHHKRTKHIDVRYHFLKNEKRIEVTKVGTY